MDLSEIPLPDYSNPISVLIYKMHINSWLIDQRYKSEMTIINIMDKIERQIKEIEDGFK